MAIVSLVDRKRRLTLLYKVAGKFEPELMASLISWLREGAGGVRTITFDDGLELTGHAKVAAATGANIFFCRPCHSRQSELAPDLVDTFIRKSVYWWTPWKSV